MGCTSCGIRNCKPDLISPHIPPRGVGWRLVGWPDFVPDSLKNRVGQNPTWDGNHPNVVIDKIRNFLKVNGVKVESVKLCQWANEQWCAADPDRCKKANTEASRLAQQRKDGYAADPMDWATPFWKVWNVAVSDSTRPDNEARAVIDLFVDAARVLVSSQLGCHTCAAHFEKLLEEYPTGKIDNWTEARVWLWRVHNESRDNKKTVSYAEIASIYGWEELTDEQVLAIVNDLRA